METCLRFPFRRPADKSVSIVVNITIIDFMGIRAFISLRCAALTQHFGFTCPNFSSFHSEQSFAPKLRPPGRYLLY